MLVCSWYPSFLSFVVLCLIPPCLSRSYPPYTPHSSPPVSYVHFLILMYFSITIVSFSPPHLFASFSRYPPPPICFLHSFWFSFVHLHTCSTPFLFLSFLSFSPLPLSQTLLSHTSFSMLRWKSHNASEERGGGGGVPFLHSIHTFSGEDVRERCNVWREKIWGNICQTHNWRLFGATTSHWFQNIHEDK